jgi:hypothetical protein
MDACCRPIFVVHADGPSGVSLLTQPPVRRPAIRAIAEGDVADAIGRLLAVARSDTGQSVRCADFLLAWWNGDDLGHFPIAHLWNVDAELGEDMLIVIAFLGQHPGAIYPDAFGYRDAIVEQVERRRDLERAGVEKEGRLRVGLLLDEISMTGWTSMSRNKPIPPAQADMLKQCADLAQALVRSLAPDAPSGTSNDIRALTQRADLLLASARRP